MKDTLQPKYTNALIHETSPYLLQHAHNPVNWYAWGDKPFEKAKNENKLVLVSIGYAACHWCHVMEKKSFENEAIAEIMNGYFVCIKVDREERPDVDQVYMSAVQLLTGSGGWPLNCFTLPDGQPVYGGTYFPPEQWLQILDSLATTYREYPARVFDAAREISEGLQSNELIQTKKNAIGFNKAQAENMFQGWKIYFDSIWGGNQQVPKFPLPVSYEFLLQFAYREKNEEALNHLNLTLTKMAHGGIYDQLAGGFSRYSVNEKWHIPHFEKMLYDNGQLVSLYSNAYKFIQNPFFKSVVNQTLGFIKTDMTRPDGAFYASYDADSEGEEGRFYVWTKKEIEKILGNDSDWFCEYYNISANGNWEGSNILWITQPDNILEKFHFTEQAFKKQNELALNKLLKERNKRVYPALDDKVLTSWNALMSIGYIDAFETFGEKEYLDIALKNGHFISTVMRQKNGGLYRNNKSQKSTINAFLDDYALTIQLFTKLYQNTFDFYWLNEAKALIYFTITHFYDETSGMFFYTSDLDAPLVTRNIEIADNVIPASNSVMANNLFDLGILFSNDDWVAKSKQMLSNVINDAEKNAAYYANWGILLQKITHLCFEVIFVGNNANNLAWEFNKHYHPNVIVAGTKTSNYNNLQIFEHRWIENETLIYVCVKNTCKLPVKNVAQAISLIGN